MFDMYNPMGIVVVFLLLSLLPFLAIMSTSFVKISIVFSLLRNAMGLQQSPPNSAIYGFALVLTFYIMAPVGLDTINVVLNEKVKPNSFAEAINLANKASVPFKTFIREHTDKKNIKFFQETSDIIWSRKTADALHSVDFLTLLPAFTISELTSAFQIGFLIYLPFFVIDVIVSNILLALGMMMVSPMTMSLPFKLFLFVMVDGWSRLIHGIIISYNH